MQVSSFPAPMPTAAAVAAAAVTAKITALDAIAPVSRAGTRVCGSVWQKQFNTALQIIAPDQ